MFDKYVNIFFYIDLALMIYSIGCAAAVFILLRRTAYAFQIGLTALFITMFAFLGYVAQLVMYSFRNTYAPYAVYAVFALICCAVIGFSAYAFALSHRSNKRLCYVTGLFVLLPPLGVVPLSKLTKRMRRDTSAQSLLFNGLAYTLAAFAAFRTELGGEFIDTSGAEEFENLSERDAFRRVKQLKKNVRDAEGAFKYAETVAHYFPKDIKIAALYMNRSAKHEYPPALFNLGYWYEIGYYYKKDRKKAREYYKRAAALGDIDATLRLGIIEMDRENKQPGVDIFRKAAEDGNVCASYDLALCHERGMGVNRDIMKAADIYYSCVERGLFVAEQKLFAIASSAINTVEYDEVFKKISEMKFDGELKNVMNGVIAVKEKRASDAANEFLDAVKQRGRWEGIARLFVGALYLDCGKLVSDKKNGAAYIKTALGTTPIAKEIFLSIPVKIRGKYDPKRDAAKAKVGSSAHMLNVAKETGEGAAVSDETEEDQNANAASVNEQSKEEV